MVTTEQPTRDQYGDEQHPAFAMIGASRVSCSPPGAVLFDSDVRHQHLVRVTLRRATRKRELNRDWLHGTAELFEVDLSEAQWASFVSSMNVGSGVPATLVYLQGEGRQPSLPYAPRLADSMAEVRSAAATALAAIREARDAYEAAVERKAPAREVRDLRRYLHYAIEHAESGMEFAAKSLSEHAENVVQRARADVEAMIVDKATQLGLDPSAVGVTLAISDGEDQ